MLFAMEMSELSCKVWLAIALLEVEIRTLWEIARLEATLSAVLAASPELVAMERARRSGSPP